jgi:hypothetical protein
MRLVLILRVCPCVFEVHHAVSVVNPSIPATLLSLLPSVLLFIFYR